MSNQRAIQSNMNKIFCAIRNRDGNVPGSMRHDGGSQ